jgi:hypothetical protein
MEVERFHVLNAPEPEAFPAPPAMAPARLRKRAPKEQQPKVPHATVRAMYPANIATAPARRYAPNATEAAPVQIKVQNENHLTKVKRGI